MAAMADVDASINWLSFVVLLGALHCTGGRAVRLATCMRAMHAAKSMAMQAHPRAGPYVWRRGGIPRTSRTHC